MKRNTVLLILVGTIVVIGMATPVSAATVFTKPYSYGVAARAPPRTGGSSFDLTNGIDKAWVKVASIWPPAWAAAHVGSKSTDLFVGYDQNIKVTIDCTLTAYQYSKDRWWWSGCIIKVNIMTYNPQWPHQQWDLETVWSYYHPDSFTGKRWTNEPIQESAIVYTGPGTPQQGVVVAVELYVDAFVVYGQAGVCYKPDMFTTPARLLVNSITIEMA